MFPSDRHCVQDTSESLKASSAERQEIDGPVLTPHSTHTTLVEKGPVAPSASFHGTRVFFSRSAPFLWLSKAPSDPAQTGIYRVFIHELRKRSA